MDFVTGLLLLLFVCSLIGIWYAIIYNKFQVVLIKISEVQGNIESMLNQEYDLLNRIAEIVKANIKTKEEVFVDLSKIKLDKLSTTELDQAMNSSINELYKLKETYPDLKTSDTFQDIDHNLIDIEEQLIGIRKYYNEKVTEYNYLLKKFPSNLVAIPMRLKEKEFYTTK